jgi:hypothetical protein
MFELFSPLPGTKFSYAKENIVRVIMRNGGYCPCISEKTDDTKCPCKVYRETLDCHCHLYIKE